MLNLYLTYENIRYPPFQNRLIQFTNYTSRLLELQEILMENTSQFINIVVFFLIFILK